MEENHLRCPECGQVTSLYGMAMIQVNRRRRSRRAYNDAMSALAVSASLLIASSSFEDSRNQLRWRLDLLTTEPGLWIVVFTCLAMFALTYITWMDFHRRDRCTFAAITTALLLAMPLAWSVILLPAWLIGVYVRALCKRT